MCQGVFLVVGTDQVVGHAFMILILLYDAFPRIVVSPVLKLVAFGRLGTPTLDVNMGIVGKLQFDGVGRNQGTTFGACGLEA